MEQTRLLDKTPLSFTYDLLCSKTDQEIVTNFSWVMVGLILVTIVWNLLGTVPYGKATVSTRGNKEGSKGLSSSWRFWEYPISSRFTWRFGFLPAVIVPWVIILFTPTPYLYNVTNLAGLMIYYLHYFNRSVIYPSRISDHATPCPAWFILGPLIVTTVHTFYQVHHLANVHKPMAVSSLTFVAIGMSILGAWLNTRHDWILTQLRARGKGYQIPEGSLFEYVSCPNYFGECLEWWGFALVTGGGRPQVLFAIFSTVFLGFRARFTRKWYHAKFGAKYPRERKAMIPFVY
ncbi:steroid 5-alpha-reductase DET2 [Folsomia candida]|uniref:Steroid 5-alpha-reductase DET2 n=1 Tax=Folsomia candida TaxID=158441 RepID=A0A226EE37_FOLCA|nr:steroid 5-alpha-reductase DET2 [Folsomia candida]XP_035707415.1 steroid 5-alpha-reductase DET2 [Folsomia candida]OXA55679.1 Steroid 5-alpha-reductase DET2 [Folsomia candida]